MNISEDDFYIEDLAMEHGQGDFDFPEKPENNYKILGRVRKYKYSITDEAEPYNYRKKNLMPVPPSYIDTFICDIWHQIKTGYKVPSTEIEKSDIEASEILYKEVNEGLIEKAVKVYCKRTWMNIAGYRPYTHCFFIRGLSSLERKLLIREIAEYIKDNGVRDIEY